MTRSPIRPCLPSDADDICTIYNHYVRESIATFEEAPVSNPEMTKRIRHVTKRLPWLVWPENGVAIGYAYATPWRERSAYRFSIESTVYVAPGFTGRRIGRRLYEALLAELGTQDVHCVLAGISLPNEASVALHESLGFVKVGHLREAGHKFGRWIDVGYWQRMADTQ